MTRIQRYSSYTFSAFLTLHIANTSLIPLATRSVPAADTYLLLTRPYYQSFPAEPLLVVLPLLAHVGAGLALRLHRRHQLAVRYGAAEDDQITERGRDRPWWPKLSGTAALGWALAPLVAGHALANRALPLWAHGGSSSIGLAFVSHAFARHRAVAAAGYAVLVGVASWHVVWGWARWLGWTPAQVVDRGVEGGWRRKQRWYAINGLSALLAGLWMAGGLGVVGQAGEAKGWLGREYDDLLTKIPVVGGWL